MRGITDVTGDVTQLRQLLRRHPNHCGRGGIRVERATLAFVLGTRLVHFLVSVALVLDAQAGDGRGSRSIAGQHRRPVVGALTIAFVQDRFETLHARQGELLASARHVLFLL